MSSKTRWFDLLTEFAYATDMFCEERKTSLHSPEIIRIKLFCTTIMHTKCMEGVHKAMNNMITDPTMMNAMKPGIIIKQGTKTGPGPFFKTKYNFEFNYKDDVGDDIEISIDFSQLMREVSIYAGKKGITETRRNYVALYLTTKLADSIKQFIIAHAFKQPKLPPDVRNSITGNTIIQEVEKPYENDHREQALKDIVRDALGRPEVAGFLEQHVKKSYIDMAKSTVNSIGVDTFHSVKGGFDKAMRDHSFGPIFDALKNTATSVAGNSHADDGIPSYMQD